MSNLTMNDTPPKALTREIRFLAYCIMAYIFIYTFMAIKYLCMSWANDMSFIFFIIPNFNPDMLDGKIPLACCTVFGAVMGGAILNITSLHRYSATTKTLDFDHLLGYLMTPLLCVIIGIICFCLLISGIFVLTGSSETRSSTTVIAGYTIFGSICGYNWDVFIKKLENLAKKMTDKNEDVKKAG
ncbi:hypothetical protein RM153_21545 (plasmid) [Pantoea agglomerans]|uniref:hypothetical protein n=1 Tax=Enterobacter agglomerans TaxID=549 RepID=UPI0028A1C9A0|nr:hypothetical protein [Pantoea agglomerans]WNK51276.1 hypothetical protein RM153_21545 [Pantoea agglomerans]